MTRWEYLLLSDGLPTSSGNDELDVASAPTVEVGDLNELGLQGWELVSVTCHAEPMWLLPSGNRVEVSINGYALKRLLVD